MGAVGFIVIVQNKRYCGDNDVITVDSNGEFFHCPIIASLAAMGYFLPVLISSTHIASPRLQDIFVTPVDRRLSPNNKYKGIDRTMGTSKGIDIQPTRVSMYTYPFNVIYTSDMNIYDDSTVYEQGFNRGMAASHIRVGRSVHNPSFTVLEFIEPESVTGEHVDKARIVGQVEIHPQDLPGLIKLLSDRANELHV